MNDNELYALQRKVNRATKIKQSIANIDRLIEKIEKGKCINIIFQYDAPSDGLFGTFDDTGEGNYTYNIDLDNKAFGINEEEYSEWFSNPLIDYFRVKRKVLEKEYEDLE